MTEAPGPLLTIAAFLLLLGPLVFVHELGHYLAGRWFGVKAEEFSIGFGREIFGLTDKRGTRWKFGWLPLGGYVKFAGDMNAASQPSAEWLALPAAERSRTFQSKPLWQRAIIVAAGPIINLALAVLILGGFALAYGDGQTPPVVGSVAPNSAAATAGMLPGDRITAIGGRTIGRFDDLRLFAAMRPGETVRADIVRGGAALQLWRALGHRPVTAAERAAAHDHTMEFLTDLRTSLKQLDRWAHWLDLTTSNTTTGDQTSSGSRGVE